MGELPQGESRQLAPAQPWPVSSGSAENDPRIGFGLAPIQPPVVQSGRACRCCYVTPVAAARKHPAPAALTSDPASSEQAASSQNSAIPEDWLAKALGAASPSQRAKYATAGLTVPGLESDTQTLLLHQLYLSFLEQRRFADALAVAEQMVVLNALPELAHQDVARAYCALGDFDAALLQWRSASRTSPASRRSVHLWCLGSTLFALGCHAEAVTALERSLRWASRDQALHRALLALALDASGKPADLALAYRDLASAEHQPGVVEWVGGAILLQLGKPELARELLETFVQRNSTPLRAVGLRAEISHAKRLLRGLEPGDRIAETVAPLER